MKTPIQYLFMIVLLTGLVTTHGYGQDEQATNKSTEEMAKAGTEKQKERLGLSDLQEEQMYEVNLKYIQKMQEIRLEGRSISTMRKAKKMSKRMDKEVKDILNKDQFKEYSRMKDERREEMKKRMRSQRGS